MPVLPPGSPTGTGAPIVFIHGMGTSSATWATCMDLLEDRFTVVAVDLLTGVILGDHAQHHRVAIDVSDQFAGVGEGAAGDEGVEMLVHDILLR